MTGAPHFNARYLKSIVFGANDGIVTTFAVVAGVAGAGLDPKIVLIMGVANMLADGLSMAAGDYLGERSEWQLKHQQDGTAIPQRLWLSGLLMFFAFVVAGSLPMLPYFARAVGVPIASEAQFGCSIVATGGTLFFVGSLRSLLIKKPWWKNGLEVLAVGSVAAGTAYYVGTLIEQLLH